MTTKSIFGKAAGLGKEVLSTVHAAHSTGYQQGYLVGKGHGATEGYEKGKAAWNWGNVAFGGVIGFGSGFMLAGILAHFSH